MTRFALLVASLLIAGSVSATEIPLKNADFEQPIAGKRIPGWARIQHAGLGAYEVTTDTKNAAHGKSSISMRRTAEQVYGLIMQRVESKDLGGKQVEMTAMLKTAKVGKEGWVMVMTFKNYSNILDQVLAAPMVGNTDWKEVVLKSVAPPTTNMVEVGFMLMDEGTGWADHVRLRSIDVESEETAAKDKPEAAGKAETSAKKGKTDKPEADSQKSNAKAGAGTR
ncbi:MAG TPA: hypothetical protein VFN25_03620 [Dokdonella sp.]|uniref:hypothetical protein n=1 Tax=Dokdonella sp. TaxID=2291710 RepID=UPI002D80C62D|nr:hypothetical protein [Dokdonella sp.]HET9031975.1 hypothetical protein [Dokdonella sp.]